MCVYGMRPHSPWKETPGSFLENIENMKIRFVSKQVDKKQKNTIIK